jgi:hypothetical protein
MEEATKQKWTRVATREISQLQNLYADYARNVGVIWEYVFERAMKVQEMYQEDILYDVVQVGVKLSSIQIDEEEKELRQIGIRTCGCDSGHMIESRGYDPEVYIGGIYKLTVAKEDGLYVFRWYKYGEEA